MISRLKWIFILALLTVNIYANDVSVKVSSQHIALGEPIKVTVITTKPIKAYKLELLNKKFKLFLEEKKKKRYKYTAMIGIKRTQKPGNYKLKIEIRLKNKFKFYESYKINLDYNTKRKIGNVNLSKRKTKLSNNKRAYTNENKLISNKFKHLSKKKYFDTKYQLPAKGRLSSEFGKLRYYNNGKTSSHAGLDISNKEGTLVAAPQKGVVVFSEKLAVHGNTIMIDHGHGVISIYCHLNKRSLNAGKRVKKGRKIGEMGMTGVSSGVHLHWGMSVQNIRVDPLFFLKNKY
jgi:murein DD-endopeptidase MepM/ murein hydrolase activator NlpD